MNKKTKNNISKKTMEEWNYEKNERLKPNSFTRFSNKKVWWKCMKCGYEWQSTINNRSKGNGCPRCAGKIPIVGKTDLATVNSELAKEWNYEKNTDNPQNYLPYSHKKVWWKCSKCGNEWEAIISSRMNGNSNCKKCNKHKE